MSKKDAIAAALAEILGKAEEFQDAPFHSKFKKPAMDVKPEMEAVVVESDDDETLDEDLKEKLKKLLEAE